jgi:hypothetical protein
MRTDLITPDGRYDKAAILRDAHCHQYGFWILTKNGTKAL